MKKIKILDVKIDSLDTKELEEKIKKFLYDDKANYIVTTNPEFVIRAGEDSEFKNILNKADLSLADGFGLKLMSFLRGINIRRVSGADLMLKICQIAEQEKKSVFFVGGARDVAKDVALKLIERFEELEIAGAEHGLKFNSFDDKKYQEENKKLLQRINNKKPDIIFVAFGAPKQEKWIFQNLDKIYGLKLAIGVGGSFDYYSKKVRRAPKAVRFIGMEWLWRFILQPWRFKRIFNAVIKFPLLFMIKQLFGGK